MNPSVGTGRAKPNSSERIERDMRASRILHLRLIGETLSSIAKKEGISVTRTAQIVQEHLTSRIIANIDEVRKLECQRLDRLQTVHWGKAIKGNTRSTRAVLKIMDQRAKLLGLYLAPDRERRDESQPEGPDPSKSLEQKLQRFGAIGEAEIARRATASPSFNCAAHMADQSG